EHGARQGGLRREEPVTAHQEARVLIGDGERIAIHAVPRAELPLEVGGPEIIRRARDDGYDARMLMRPTAPTASDEAAARQQLRGGARGGPVLDSRDGAPEAPAEVCVRPNRGAAGG